MKRLHITALIWGICLICVLSVVVYTYIDNQYVIIVEQEIVIQNLPDVFDGFTILQVSDLHGKYFGKNQVTLTSFINQTSYDMIAITGDMSDGYQEDDHQAFLDLLAGIKNKTYAFYADGNTGPWGLATLDAGLETGALTEDGMLLEANGIHNLNQVYSIQRGKNQIWIGEFWYTDLIRTFNIAYSEHMLSDLTLSTEEQETYQNAQDHARQLLTTLETLTPEECLIGITHAPFSIDSKTAMPEIKPSYDLILAGHYHGGQIRLPFIGALYVPDGASERRGFFPQQDEISGLKDWGGFQQYISRGLGSSSSIPFFNFRFLNTPEINLITLRSERHP